MSTISAYAAQSSSDTLKPFSIERRATNAHDIKIAIDYCGVCHSDIHMARNEWGGTIYPVVPGHEIIGHIVEVGSDVSSYQVGDRVGVGCMVDACRQCSACGEGLEQYCENGMVLTYNSPDKYLGGMTYGGYSQQIVVDENFVLRIPDSLDLKATAPLLCAGITTWSPLKQWQVKKGDKVGVIGLGGLGHMGVKLAHALGAEVVMITTSPQKGEDARILGADEMLISTDSRAMAQQANSFDFLLNTIPVAHEMDPYMALLKRDATMVIVGAIEPLKPLHGRHLIMGRKRLAGSLIGGIKETQEMLDFCGEHNIVADVEVITMQAINDAYERMINADVKYRFVIDMNAT